MSSRSAERPPRHAQRGVALITVMLVFVLATMIATQMLRSSYMAMRRTGNLVDSTQARYFALGAEELGRQLLLEDAKSARAGQESDHLGETWARDGLQFEIEDGQLEIAISDLAGRFNLNNLVDANGKTLPVEVARFARLLQLLQIDPSVATMAADWVDADESTARGGSEASELGLRALLNRPMVDPSELRILPGLEGEAWARLEHFVAALPPGTSLNINTASPEVLYAYCVENIRMGDVERFLLLRKQQPITDASDPRIGPLFGSAVTGLDVKSDFFAVRVHARYRERHVRFESHMQRGKGEQPAQRGPVVRLIGRSDSARMQG
ncbi:MAG: type II secretion system minor pseudopilin GspK [Gammaproteobacteria bacterium]